MRSLWKSVFGLWVMVVWFGVSAPAQAASGVGPYYAVPSWDQTLPADTRFIVLTNMNSEAVLDRETGVVWERSPSTLRLNQLDATTLCMNRTVGNRMGWRLPTIQELMSLIDPTVSGFLRLPAGHPFVGIVSGGRYWSSTSWNQGISAAAFVMGTEGSAQISGRQVANHSVWCVRSPQGVDIQ